MTNFFEAGKAEETLRQMGKETAANAVMPYVANKQHGADKRAMKLLQEWGTQVAGNPAGGNPMGGNLGQPGGQDLQALIQQVLAPQNPKRQEAMTALAKFKDPKAAVALVNRMVDPNDKPHAIRLLKEMGPVAEPVVAQLFTPQNRPLWIDACNILKDIGTAQSVAVLSGVANQDKKGTLGIRNAAMQAIQGIRARGGMPR